MATTINKDLVRRLNVALWRPQTQRFLDEALPAGVKRHLTPARMARVALAAFEKTPALWDCEILSVVRSVVDAASVGIEPVGGILAHGYLVPFRNSKTGKMECQFMIGYQGLIDLARRSGEFTSLEAHAVYENDKLTLRYGFDPAFEHVPVTVGKRGNFIGAYCLAAFKNGERQVQYMPQEEIEKHKQSSKTGRKDVGPWRDWYDEMAVKTAIRKAAKFWPKSPEVSAAIAMEDGVRSNKAEELVFDAELEKPAETSPAPAKLSRGSKLAQKLEDAEEPDEEAPADEDEEEDPWNKHLEEDEDDAE